MPAHTMNAAPLKRTLSVTGLLLTGAGCGVVAIKVVAPQFLSPNSASAVTLPTGGEGGGGGDPMAAVPRTTVKPRVTAAAAAAGRGLPAKPRITVATPLPTAATPPPRSASAVGAADPGPSVPSARPASKSL
jgi:hypothetical protein